MAAAGSLLRILDANANRAREAMRVCEDLARFVKNDKALAGRLKKCRHELTQVLLALPVSYAKLLAARDAARDLGRRGWIRDKKKAAWSDLMISNLKRAQEALRVLEEVSKVCAAKSSPEFQKLRFDLYELEKRALRRL